MLVPRSFKYSCPPPTPVVNHKSPLRNASRDKLPETPDASQRPRATERPQTPPQTPDDMIRTPSQPVDVPSPEKARFSGSKTVGHARGRAVGAGKRKDQTTAQHRPDALSPAVAALLAMTTIPRRPRQPKRRAHSKRHVSIDELVLEWKSDDSLAKSYESSPLSILLEDADEQEGARSCSYQSDPYPRSSYERSDSSDSVPSLEGDSHSMFSLGSPATPLSIRSRKSSMVARKESPRILPVRECCAEDHPLVTISSEEDEEFDFSPSHDSAVATKSRSSFKSNLTTSLQALKLAAFSPFATRKAASSQTLRSRRPAKNSVLVSQLSDDNLWSHPFLFPRLSSEMRPAYNGTPTSAQRRYFNPIPLSFEEQEAPFQQALHAPYLAEQQAPGMENAPVIQMQTYSRSGSRVSKGRNASNRTDVDADAEGAAINAAAAAAIRQREPRENSDFLRVVVLEMNMRREGKLEMGRAKIWLPPRQSVESDAIVQGKVPRRWIGESAA